MDDTEIIAVVLAGDAEAFRPLVDRHSGIVFSFVRNLIRHRPDAEDLCQETFVAAYHNLGSFDPRMARFSTWLLSIARNRCLTLLRRRTAQPAGVPHNAVNPLVRGFRRPPMKNLEIRGLLGHRLPPQGSCDAKDSKRSDD